MEKKLIVLILITGWPVLILMSVLIVKRGRGFYVKLKDTILGKFIIPTIFGWLFGMYMLGIVSTAYMFNLKWYFTVIPAFSSFLVAIFIVYKAISAWEKEALELHDLYKNLEEGVKKRTKALEEAHRTALQHEKEIQKLKDQFVYIAAHELKTPVTAIRWNVETLLDEGKDVLKPEIMESLKDVQTSNLRLISLVDDLLNVARMESGTISIEMTEVDLNDVLLETIKEMQPIFKRKDIDMQYVPGTCYTIHADRNRLKQVIINLLSNATKYNKDHGKIFLTIDCKKKIVFVSVKDTGIGIAQKDMDKLFTKFGRIENEKTKDIESTGLGLYLTKEIVAKMGGTITAKSEVGKGTTFTFTLSLAEKAQ